MNEEVEEDYRVEEPRSFCERLFELEAKRKKLKRTKTVRKLAASPKRPSQRTQLVPVPSAL